MTASRLLLGLLLPRSPLPLLPPRLLLPMLHAVRRVAGISMERERALNAKVIIRLNQSGALGPEKTRGALAGLCAERFFPANLHNGPSPNAKKKSSVFLPKNLLVPIFR